MKAPLLLSYLNVSNASNLEADSGFVFQETLLAGLRALGWETVLVGPPGIASSSSSSTIEVGYPESKYGARFGFGWDALSDELRRFAPVDALLVNQPELTAPLQALVASTFGKKPRTGVYFHYIPVENVTEDGIEWDPSLNQHGFASTIWARQVEAAALADFAMIGSSWGAEWFERAAMTSGAAHVNLEVVPPPASVVDRPHVESGLVSVLYNHRLYGHYGTPEMLDWLQELHSRRPGAFEVVFTNPTGQRSAERRRLDPSVDEALQRIGALPFARVQEARSREEYSRLLTQSDIGLGPLRNNALWNMSIADVMGAGRPVAAPDRGAFTEIVGDTELLFDDRESFLVVMEKLIDTREHRLAKGREALDRAAMWAPAEVARRVDDLLGLRSPSPRARELVHPHGS
ncbi:glycosyltransferase family 4 protein [Curtobacterium flaccumfaciens]|uniref:glycosyltransferase family 4 protein n=1 Tax=Curtobacterium flaccumfaciens TaxID=2035 RepID=UPI00112E8E1A|nr:glycosyltransferase family 4 protein [Curtobacterium flaccumfaciens]TPG05120.1 hypothetical protein EAH85_14215 [Curtobacterium flaccumfaciens]